MSAPAVLSSRHRDNKPDDLMTFGAFVYDDLGIRFDAIDRPLKAFETAYGLVLYMKDRMNILQGDLLNACQQIHGDDYHGLLGLHGDNDAAAHTAATRKWVMGQTPRFMRHAALRYCHYEQVAAGWIPEDIRGLMLSTAVIEGWTVPMFKAERMEVWLERFGDLPYTPANARAVAQDAQAVLDAWNAGGRDAHEARALAGPPLPRLKGCVTELRRIVRLEVTLGREVIRLERVQAFTDQIAEILEEMKA